MRITLADIKSKYPNIADSLPDMLLNLKAGNYFIFGYDDEKHGGGINIIPEAMKVYPQIDLSIYKVGLQTAQHIGYFNEPFETGNILFYKMLKFFANASKGDKFACAEEVNKLYKISSAREQAENNYVFSPTYENTFSIVDSASMQKALLRFFRLAPDLVNPVLSVFDSVDGYCQKNKGKNFYGNYLEKIVHAVPSPDGGLIPEGTGNMRYMYVGQKTAVKEEKDKLDTAKKLMRDGAHGNYIYNKTGWFVNRFDGKWRMLVSDEDCEFTTPVELMIKDCVTSNEERFFNAGEDIVIEFKTKKEPDIAKFVENNRLIMVDILNHPKLYEAYPALKFLKVFIGVSLTKKMQAFYSRDGYLVVYANPVNHNIKRILLHEIQHWVQHQEGFGGGGNTQLSAMVSALGGSNFRSYLNTMQRAIGYFATSGKCTYENTQALCSAAKSDNMRTHYEAIAALPKELFIESKAQHIVMALFNAYYNSANPNIETIYFNAYGEEFVNIFIKMKELMNQGKFAGLELSRLGYSSNEINLIYFKLYESISGELESRDTQNMPYRDSLIKQYPNVFIPLSSEAYNPLKVEVINYNEKLTGTYLAACEVTDENKYIIHLTAGIKSEHLFHELGHILWDLLPSKNNDSKEEEVFVESFIYYLFQNISSEKIKKELSYKKKADDKYNTFFKSIFN